MAAAASDLESAQTESHLGRRAASDPELSGHDAVNAAEKDFRRGISRNYSVRTELQCPTHIRPIDAIGENNRPHAIGRQRRHDARGCGCCRLESEQQDVGARRLCECDSLRSARALADDLESRIGFEQSPETVTKD